MVPFEETMIIMIMSVYGISVRMMVLVTKLQEMLSEYEPETDV